MAEYVERAYVVGEITSSKAQAELKQMDGCSAYNRVLEILNSATAADVAPVVHGHWIPYHEADIGWDEYGVKCSVCNFEVESLNIRLVCNHYCPNCGAQMKG